MKKTVCYALFVGVCLGASSAVAQVTDEDGFYFWRWGHMEGPHDSSRCLGISRDGETVVGSTMVVDFWRAWRSDIDWAIATDDGVPPLFNELKVQEDIGIIAPSQPSAAFAASDMLYDPNYDLTATTLDWGGSRPVGTIMGGTVSYGIEWLLPVLDEWVETDFVKIPDYGGGLADMQMKDVSADGTIAVGFGNNKKGKIAFRADLTDPLLPVVKPLTITDSVYTLQTLQWTAAEACSADAMIIAGYGGTKTGNRAFVTTVMDASTDPITLLSVVLPNIAGGKWAEAYAMCAVTDVPTLPADYIIAGRSDSPKGPQACIWYYDGTAAAWVVKPLGGLSKKSLNSVAYSIAYRPGSLSGELIVVGRSATVLYPSEAFVWTGNRWLSDLELTEPPGYMYDLEYILTKTGVGELSGFGSEWILNEATGVAFGADGTRIVGWGTNPEGGEEAWVVTGYPFDELIFIKE